MLGFIDPLYFVFALPALILGLIAQAWVQSAFKKYSRVPVSSGMTGAQAARALLDANGLSNVRVEETGGFLGDHYDPSSRTLRLSPQVARTPSVAAVGVAAHEMGHAIQHASGYWPLQIRTSMVPTVQFGSWLGPAIFFVGLLLQSPQIAWIGVLAFLAVAVFAVVTLPVELNASHRAKELLQQHYIVSRQEMAGVNTILNAAALTYVAAAVQAVSTLLYYVFLLGGLSRRD
jgi:Zn-dependent membrane protease YugP